MINAAGRCTKFLAAKRLVEGSEEPKVRWLALGPSPPLLIRLPPVIADQVFFEGVADAWKPSAISGVGQNPTLMLKEGAQGGHDHNDAASRG